jgi:hypothetical protein
METDYTGQTVPAIDPCQPSFSRAQKQFEERLLTRSPLLAA